MPAKYTRPYSATQKLAGPTRARWRRAPGPKPPVRLRSGRHAARPPPARPG